MGAGSIILVAMCVFVVFTSIVGTGLVFYQQTLTMDVGGSSSSTVLVRELGGTLVFTFFILGALIFLAGATRWVTSNRQ